MINARRKQTNPTPIWATLGAPLLGIPLLVALLSMAAPEPAMEEGAEWSAAEQAQLGLTATPDADGVTVEAEAEAVFVTGGEAEECEGPADQTETKEG